MSVWLASLESCIFALKDITTQCRGSSNASGKNMAYLQHVPQYRAKEDSNLKIGLLFRIKGHEISNFPLHGENCNGGLPISEQRVENKPLRSFQLDQIRNLHKVHVSQTLKIDILHHTSGRCEKLYFFCLP